MNTSYFEIGGKVVECLLHQEAANTPTFGTPFDELVVMVGQKSAEVVLSKAVSKTTKKESYDPLRASRAPGRARRARYALQTAAALAAVDGPLPFGDALAIGVLGTYATYEIVGAVGDIIQ